MNLKLFLACSMAFCTLGAVAQKKALDQSVYDGWKSVESPTLTDDGAWAYYGIKPQRGDSELTFYNVATAQKTTFPRGVGANYFNNGTWASFQVKAPFAAVRQAKIDKLKPEKSPKDTTMLVELGTMKTIALPKAKGIATAKDGALMAYAYEVMIPKDSTKKESKEVKYDRLVILNVATNDSTCVDSVKRYVVDQNGTMVLYTKEVDSLKAVYAYTTDLKKGNKHTLLFESKIGKIATSLAMDEAGSQAAFMAATDSVAHAQYALYYFDRASLKTKQIAQTINGLPEDYALSAFGSLSFNKEGTRLQFGIAPKPKKVPTPEKLPDDEKIALDIWSYQDTIIQPQQLVEKQRLAERNYAAVYFPRENRALALGDYYLPSISFAENADAPYAVGTTSQPYAMFTKNEIQTFTPADTYLIDLKTGKRTLIREAGYGGSYLSPTSNYVGYFNLADSSWYSIDTKTLNHKRLTADIPHSFFNSDHDQPSQTPLYGMYGWTTQDQMLIPDRYDLWLVDPAGKPSVNLTKTGRETNTQFRFVNRPQIPGKSAVDLSKEMLFLSFNRVNKENGYYALTVGGPMQKFVEGPYIYAIASQAKDADRILYTRENFNEFRDLWTSNKAFKNEQKITNANPQQTDYKWGSVDLIHWTDFNGQPCEGLLHFPEDYDSTKTYPVIVYFYEKQTFLRYRHNSPGPSRSIINPVYCTSNDYIVFIPDINYRDGFPGKSCYDAVVSGTMALIDRGIADPKHIGLQGQSWGGYQTAYLVTQTDLYACSAPGALVSNMISAYGGIRWSSGMSRAFQYEITQSRIGATPWQRRDLYIDNSPIFFADRVTTPQLMRHCDQDGAVPWYQSIEYYIALRRLGRPVWLINYNGEQHNLESRAACMDWDKRMYQFLDHYLKDAPMPRWMKEGITSNEKGIDQKLELVKE